MPMRKLILLSILSVFCIASFAQLNGDGYYRVHNKGSERYVYVCDNTGSINYTATTAEMGAIQLWKDHTRTLSDPASVIYITKKGTNGSGDYFDFQSQGTGVHDIIGYYVNLYSSDGTYQVYAEGKYLCDNETSSIPQGAMGTDRKGDYRKWMVSKIGSDDEWFGITPTTIAGRKFRPFFADFGFSLKGEGMKVWYISLVNETAAVIKEFDGSVVPARTPVLIECTSDNAADNKLELIYSYAAGPSDNIMKGVYFNNQKRVKKNPNAVTACTKDMRFLGAMKDGSLGFITKTTGNVDANSSYLVGCSALPAQIPVMTEADYLIILAEKQRQQEIADSIRHAEEMRQKEIEDSIRRADSIAARVPMTVNVGKVEVYSISGRLLGNFAAEEVQQLPAGIYIMGRKKLVIE